MLDGRRRRAIAITAIAVLLSACGAASGAASSSSPTPTHASTSPSTPSPTATGSNHRQRRPEPNPERRAATSGARSPAAGCHRWCATTIRTSTCPNGTPGTVEVIDPTTFKVVRRYSFGAGAMPEHVTPAWDLRHLYVDVDARDALAVIDPRTGQARPHDPRHRSPLQPVLHAGRHAGDRRRRVREPPRLHGPAHVAQLSGARAALQRLGPHGLLARTARTTS